MIYFISIIHALTCIFIILFILLQDPKGGVLGSLGGGGSKAFFGAEGASSFLVTITKWLAISFACTSFYLSYISAQKDSSLMSPEAQTEQSLPVKEKTDKTPKNMADTPESSKETK